MLFRSYKLISKEHQAAPHQESKAVVESPEIEVKEEKPLTESATEQNEVADESEDILLIEIEIDSPEYRLSDDISAAELENLSKTLSRKIAPIEDEITAVKTLGKMENSPFMKAIYDATGTRVKNMFANVAIHTAKINRGDFDSSKYIR